MIASVQPLSGKRILLGISGSIAVYKAVDILRRLTERGAEVHVVMTKNAERFVPRLTFEALSKRAVLCDEFENHTQSAIGHIEFTDRLDLALIAPATANIIGKIVSGIADDALTSSLMAVSCPLLVAPAMNERMYRNPILQRNIQSLREIGIHIVEPGTGSLACGTVGKGRLADTDTILSSVSSLLAPRDLEGKTILITAGPTREPIDPVRFISNPSSGKMGYALAAAARDRGGSIILVSGPTALTPPQGVDVIRVTTAAEMKETVLRHAPKSDIVIMAAAVSDFRPVQTAVHKIKKERATLTLELERTDDILMQLGSIPGERLLVGFAAETDAIEQNALQKLKKKNLDLIVVNNVLQPGSGFETDTNAVMILDRNGNKHDLPTMVKSDVASYILNTITTFLRSTNSQTA
ncbi:MAG: bifunctional phosphopantothenoylcysteine decarboxylase/phosphopantothenate--cysteine ligase CoaBC [Nitrospirota bacterium]